MPFVDLISSRGSIRDYKPDPVEPEKLNLLFEAVRLAPSAANRQPYKLYLIATEGRKDELRRVYNSDWFVQPPYVVGLCLINDLAWKRSGDERSYGMVDAAIAFDHLILMATELGLGTCWLAAFDPDAAREVMRLPDNLTPVLFSPLGYPAADPMPKRRKSIQDLVVRM